MGQKFFGIDLQSEIGNAMTAADMVSFLFQKKVTGVRTPNSLAGGTNNTTPVDYACHGWVRSFTRQEMLDAPLIQRGDKRVLIIAKPLADAGVEPEIDDYIIIGGETLTIMDVGSNSAKAVWKCQCRG